MLYIITLYILHYIKLHIYSYVIYFIYMAYINGNKYFVPFVSIIGYICRLQGQNVVSVNIIIYDQIYP